MGLLLSKLARSARSWFLSEPVIHSPSSQAAVPAAVQAANELEAANGCKSRTSPESPSESDPKLPQPKYPLARSNSLATGVFQQVSGHSDTFMRISEHEIWKLTDTPEQNMLCLLMKSAELRSLVPEYFREVPLSSWTGREPPPDAVCVALQDLTSGFGEFPSVMDIKIGARTFLEDEVSNLKLRPDLLQKMDKLDSAAATAEERESGGITKLRYMQFREQMSSSSTLGFRVEGISVARGLGNSMPSKAALAAERTQEGVLVHLRTFVGADLRLKELYLERLSAVAAALPESPVFQNHQFINTSLLFVHDEEKTRAGVWMIDFSKARPSNERLTHMLPWELGNQEDGYLWGLQNLRRLWESI